MEQDKRKSAEGEEALAAAIEKLKTSVIIGASNVNKLAEEQKINHNHTAYGNMEGCAYALRLLGLTVKIPVWEQDGYLRCEKPTITS